MFRKIGVLVVLPLLAVSSVMAHRGGMTAFIFPSDRSVIQGSIRPQARDAQDSLAGQLQPSGQAPDLAALPDPLPRPRSRPEVLSVADAFLKDGTDLLDIRELARMTGIWISQEDDIRETGEARFDHTDHQGNRVQVERDGAGDLAYVAQFGLLNGVEIEQSGSETDANLLILQQWGEANAARIVQIGDLHRATAAQRGASNALMQYQYGFGNVAKADQEGVGNWASQTQF